LYVILDIFSGYVVGWMAATRESAALAEKLIAATCAKQGITGGQLSIHASRGSSMTSKPAALLLGTWASPSPIPARTCPTTTRIPRRSSRR
jgi:putative transposase